MRLPPGPEPHRNPLATLRYFRAITSDVFGFVRGRFEQFGDVYYAPVRGTGLYVMRHPDQLDEVLRIKARSFEKTRSGFAAARLTQLLGEGLVNANGDAWRRHRRMINPALTRRRIQGYAPTISAYSTDIVKGWRVGETIDVGRMLDGLTLRIVTKALFDQDAGPYVDSVHAAMQAFRDSQGVGAILPSWVRYPPNAAFEDALAEVNTIIMGMIAERRRNPGGEDLLSSLLAATDDEGGLDAEQIRDELLTLFFAGHETTSNALLWTLYLLGRNPDVSDWLREEVRGLDGGLCPDDLPRLVRTQACIEEAMRLFPPVCVISRTATEDVEIGGYDVTKGSEVLAWFYFTHRDARWFPEPEKYRPQRFLEEPTWPKGAYMPFGAGQRTCIGKHFALMEATLILATLLRHHRLEAIDATVPDPLLTITLAPRDPLRMRVQRA